VQGLPLPWEVRNPWMGSAEIKFFRFAVGEESRGFVLWGTSDLFGDASLRVMLGLTFSLHAT